MSGVFDRLQKQLEIRKREEGISALELRDLPADLRKIMRMMLREVVIKHTDLRKKVAEMPDASLSPKELDAALAVLVEQGWLLRYGDGEFTSFKVNLRRRAGSQLGTDIWSALDSKLIKEKHSGSSSEETHQD